MHSLQKFWHMFLLLLYYIIGSMVLFPECLSFFLWISNLMIVLVYSFGFLVNLLKKMIIYCLWSEPDFNCSTSNMVMLVFRILLIVWIISHLNKLSINLGIFSMLKNFGPHKFSFEKNGLCVFILLQLFSTISSICIYLPFSFILDCLFFPFYSNVCFIVP